MARVEARERAARAPSRTHSSPRRALVSPAFRRARRAPAPSASRRARRRGRPPLPRLTRARSEKRTRRKSRRAAVADSSSVASARRAGERSRRVERERACAHLELLLNSALGARGVAPLGVRHAQSETRLQARPAPTAQEAIPNASRFSRQFDDPQPNGRIGARLGPFRASVLDVPGRARRARHPRGHPRGARTTFHPGVARRASRRANAARPRRDSQRDRGQEFPGWCAHASSSSARGGRTT